METTMHTPTNELTATLDTMQTAHVKRERALRYAKLMDDYRYETEQIARMSSAPFDAPIETLKALITLAASVPDGLHTRGRAIESRIICPGGFNVRDIVQSAAAEAIDQLQCRDAKRLANLARARENHARLLRALKKEFPDEFGAFIATAAQ
jgi:hypothetical protein